MASLFAWLKHDPKTGLDHVAEVNIGSVHCVLVSDQRTTLEDFRGTLARRARERGQSFLLVELAVVAELEAIVPISEVTIERPRRSKQRTHQPKRKARHA